MMLQKICSFLNLPNLKNDVSFEQNWVSFSKWLFKCSLVNLSLIPPIFVLSRWLLFASLKRNLTCELWWTNWSSSSDHVIHFQNPPFYSSNCPRAKFQLLKKKLENSTIFWASVWILMPLLDTTHSSMYKNPNSLTFSHASLFFISKILMWELKNHWCAKLDKMPTEA